MEKLKIIERENEFISDGDGLRGDSVRCSSLTETYASPEDAKEWETLPDYLQAMEAIVGMSYADYCYYVCSLAEDSNEELMEIISSIRKEVSVEFHRCFQEIKYEIIGVFSMGDECPYEKWVRVDINSARYLKIGDPDPLLREKLRKFKY